MDAARLIKLGFVLGVGQVDRKGKNYGTFNRQGVYLTPEGEELVARLEAGDDPAAPPPTPEALGLVPPKRAPGRPRKAAVEAPVVEDKVEGLASLVAEVDGALGDLN